MAKKETHTNIINKISLSEAGKIAGVTRQAIHDIKKRGTYDFFDGKQVDTSSDEWTRYLQDRENAEKVVNAPALKNTDKNVSDKKIDNQSGKSDSKKKLTKAESEIKQENSLIGGFSINNFPIRNLADVERLAKIQKLEIEMRIRLGELMERELVDIFINSVKYSVQSHIVDLPRRVSGYICEKLERVGMEREVEKILIPECAKAVKEIKKSCNKQMKVKKLYDSEKMKKADSVSNGKTSTKK